MQERKTIVHVNHLFKLWMITTWLTHIKNKKVTLFFQIYVTMTSKHDLHKNVIAKQFKYLYEKLILTTYTNAR